MKCICCNEDIEEFDTNYEWLCPGDAIHKRCKPIWEKQLRKICSMADGEFERWLFGEDDNDEQSR